MYIIEYVVYIVHRVLHCIYIYCIIYYTLLYIAKNQIQKTCAQHKHKHKRTLHIYIYLDTI